MCKKVCRRKIEEVDRMKISAGEFFVITLFIIFGGFLGWILAAVLVCALSD